METPFAKALIAGLEELTAWSELLDEINVFPVADGDTGRNLVLSLAPLRQADQGLERAVGELLVSARGNSGNIMARFLSGLLMAETPEALAEAVREGRDRARQAVADPQNGTILSVFDALAEALASGIPEAGPDRYDAVLGRLEEAVAATAEGLPALRSAGVVDAGALGAFLFFRGFFASQSGLHLSGRPVTEVFAGRLRLSPSLAFPAQEGHCIDTVLEVAEQAGDPGEALSRLGESVVVLREGSTLKVHLHARDDRRVRGAMDGLGKVVRWSADDLAVQTRTFTDRPAAQAIHIMTDAAGSLSRLRAKALGITLLDSYLVFGGKALPETRVSPGELYAAMARGEKVSTSQASLAERQASYRSVRERYPRTLYLCVGSVYTGNYGAASQWQRDTDPEGRLTVIDSGAASGRLGLLALAAARMAAGTEDPEAVIRYVRGALIRCRELIFLDQLQYLAAGGRISRAGALAGDLMGMKPVITPAAKGAKAVGLVRDREGQRRFARKRLAEGLAAGGEGGLILLEHTDNAEWVKGELQTELAGLFPRAELLVEPMSLTSGAHMGPGTWAVAFLPEAPEAGQGEGR